MNDFLHEFLMTFSNNKSLFSSKRIERFAIFLTMLVASGMFLFKGVLSEKLSAGDLMIVVVGWLGYAGFNTIQGKSNVENNSESKE